jgi:hypothetical protein
MLQVGEVVTPDGEKFKVDEGSGATVLTAQAKSALIAQVRCAMSY